jgi:hypothetical protein
MTERSRLTDQLVTAQASGSNSLAAAFEKMASEGLVQAA